MTFDRGSLLSRTVTGLSVFALVLTATAYILFDSLVVTPLLERAAADKAASIVLAAQTWLELPEERRVEFEVELSLFHGLVVSEVSIDLPSLDSDASYYQLLQRELEERLDTTVTLKSGEGNLWIDVPRSTSTSLQVGFNEELPFQEQVLVGTLVSLFAGFFVFVASVFIVRAVAKPLVEVSRAVEQFRGGTEFTHLPETGPHELVTLAANFNQMARDVSQLLDGRTVLLAGVSHDIRTPLTRIILELERLSPELPPEFCEKLSQNVHAIRRLLDNVMEFASGVQEPGIEVELREMVQSIVDSFDQKVPIQGDSQSTILVSLPPNVFERVFTNLIENAFAYGKDPYLVVKTSTSVVEITVCDKGPGIPEAEHTKVFQPFYRVDKSRSRELGGSGLGLAIVQQLCELHSWHVELESTPNSGTRVRVSIPRQKMPTTALISTEYS